MILRSEVGCLLFHRGEFAVEIYFWHDEINNACSAMCSMDLFPTENLPRPQNVYFIQCNLSKKDFWEKAKGFCRDISTQWILNEYRRRNLIRHWTQNFPDVCKYNFGRDWIDSVGLLIFDKNLTGKHLTADHDSLTHLTHKTRKQSLCTMAIKYNDSFHLIDSFHLF